HRLEDRVHGAVGEAQQLVGARALGPRQPPAYRRRREREHLTILEVVVRLLRPSQGRVLDGLRAQERRSEEGESRELMGTDHGGGAHSGSRVYRLRTTLLASTCTASLTVLKPACSMRSVCRPGLTAYSTTGV